MRLDSDDLHLEELPVDLDGHRRVLRERAEARQRLREQLSHLSAAVPDRLVEVHAVGLHAHGGHQVQLHAPQAHGLSLIDREVFHDPLGHEHVHVREAIEELVDGT